MIPVTKTFLPHMDEYQAILQRAWDKQWITNRGELVLELEAKLKEYLSVKNIIVTSNGTIPIQIALNLLAGEGEVITTPFSYVATVAAIVWEKCTPVFVDIHTEYLTIDETKIEQAITSRTTAILATHVFGNPCNVEVIEDIARRNNLKVIYDAAHCFGVKYNNKSIFDYGDISTCSFHATKLFHTGEGGAMFCKDDELNRKLFYTHNFGHDGPLAFHGLGINGKMSELNAALGLAVLPYMSFILEERRRVVAYYNEHLDFSKLNKIKIRENTEWNYSYYPVVFESEEVVLDIMRRLKEVDVIPRRYFYPSLNTIEYVHGGNMPISERVANRVVCLPLYQGMEPYELDQIVDVINA